QPPPHYPPEVIAEEDLVLNICAPLVAVVAVGGYRDVKTVVAVVATITQDMTRPNGAQVGSVDVECRRVEGEREKRSGHLTRQDVHGVAIQDVGEEPDVRPALLIPAAEVRQGGSAVDIEGTYAAVNHSFSAGNATGEHKLPGVRQLVVDPRIEFRLRRTGVG